MLITKEEQFHYKLLGIDPNKLFFINKPRPPEAKIGAKELVLLYGTSKSDLNKIKVHATSIFGVGEISPNNYEMGYSWELHYHCHSNSAIINAITDSIYDTDNIMYGINREVLWWKFTIDTDRARCYPLLRKDLDIKILVNNFINGRL